MRFLFFLSFLILFFSCSKLDIDLSNVGNYPKANIDYYADPKTKALFDAYLADRLKRRNLPPFRYGAFTVHLYVITEGHLAVPANFDVKVLKHMYESWSIIGINPILSQLGVWIKEAKICRIKSIYGVPNAPGTTNSDDFTTGNLIPGNEDKLDSWVYKDESNYNLTTAATEDGDYGCPTRTGGQSVVAKTDQFRILWHHSIPDVGYSISRFGVLVNRMNHNHGRNLIAHEIGHNFHLPHVVDTYDAPCSISTDPTRIMYTPIFAIANTFAPCETVVAQANIACYTEGGPCVQYPSTTVKIEDPPQDRFNEGLIYLTEKFTPIGCRQTFNFDIKGNRRPFMENFDRKTNLTEQDRLPEKYCDEYGYPASTLIGRGLGKQYDLDSPKSRNLARIWLNVNVSNLPANYTDYGSWDYYCWGSWGLNGDENLDKAICRYTYKYSVGGSFTANNEGCDYRFIDRLQKANNFPIYFTDVDNAKCTAPALPARGR